MEVMGWMHKGIKFVFKNFIVSLLICSFISSQKVYEFTEEQVLGLYNSIQQLEYADSINTSIIVNLNEQIDLYTQYIFSDSIIIAEQQKQLQLKDDVIKQIKPAWHDNKYLWYTYGIVSVIIPVWLVGQLK